MCQKVLILVLLSAHVKRVSISRKRDFLDGLPQIFCWILTKLCHVDNLKSIRGPKFPVESHETFGGHSGWYYSWFELLSRNSEESEVHFVITTNFQTLVRGAQGYPTGSMISRIVPCPRNYSFVVSKHSIRHKAVCNQAPNTFDSTTCRPAVRLRRWLLNWYLFRQRQRDSTVV